MTHAEALVEVCHRYQAIIRGLVTAVAEVEPHLEGEQRKRAADVVFDTEAQLTAVSDHLDSALKEMGIDG